MGADPMFTLAAPSFGETSSGNIAGVSGLSTTLSILRRLSDFVLTCKKAPHSSLLPISLPLFLLTDLLHCTPIHSIVLIAAAEILREGDIGFAFVRCFDLL